MFHAPTWQNQVIPNKILPALSMMIYKTCLSWTTVMSNATSKFVFVDKQKDSLSCVCVCNMYFKSTYLFSYLQSIIFDKMKNKTASNYYYYYFFQVKTVFQVADVKHNVIPNSVHVSWLSGSVILISVSLVELVRTLLSLDEHILSLYDYVQSTIV